MSADVISFKPRRFRENLIKLRDAAEQCECDFDCYCAKNIGWVEAQLEKLDKPRRAE